MNKKYFAHVSGKITKKAIDKVLKFWDGEFNNSSDKGIIFFFTKESDRNGFVNEINKNRNLFAENSN